MDNLFVRESLVVSYQDDILITGSSDAEHLDNLDRVLYSHNHDQLFKHIIHMHIHLYAES